MRQEVTIDTHRGFFQIMPNGRRRLIPHGSIVVQPHDKTPLDSKPLFIVWNFVLRVGRSHVKRILRRSGVKRSMDDVYGMANDELRQYVREILRRATPRVIPIGVWITLHVILQEGSQKGSKKGRTVGQEHVLDALKSMGNPLYGA